jgi:hypothetical protein
MDPNVTLARIRAIRKELIEGGLSDGAIAILGEELSELITALDGWISHGGFLPKAWVYSNYTIPTPPAHYRPPNVPNVR